MLRLMIVDDEQIIREALTRMIDYKSIGYELVATAKNGMEAYDIICDEYPDVVITDIRMPFLSGLDLIERSLKTDSRITFILLSGYSEFDYAKQAMQYGVRHYLLKPTNKQELLDTLVSIRSERLLAEEQEKERQNLLLHELQGSLEQCFITEALEYPEEFVRVFEKYQPLLPFPSSGTTACICSYVEENCLRAFAADIHRFPGSRQYSLCFPVIYVKNNAILVFDTMNLELQEQLQRFLENLKYAEQSVSFVPQFLHAASSRELFQTIMLKLARFQQILLCEDNGCRHEIRNNIASPQRVSRLRKRIARADDEQQLNEILDSIFTEDIAPEAARNLALGIFLGADPQPGHESLQMACDFFSKLYSCPAVTDIHKLMQVVLSRDHRTADAPAANTNITRLKDYVQQHLDSENLSLKWLAEHYLYVSVGYLSKQFVKEEGQRFSDYLNRKRVEEAERLMVLYRGDNIKSIARQVGFSSNPQYFSQVFKRYTGLTPTDYIERLVLVEQ